ncbi:GNAT family N-acetyltransferase [Paenibacillus pinihumi]|uniref:GNAT family N-acetyltransferase n=1 Tax=Paenibacillus pinihumi TaxID=669462 RepID=UPI000410A548|nr:GNAT family N-acetyltransferase [Paenibacillus pinihumi]
MNIRQAAAEDAYGIAHAHLEAWHQAYKNIIDEQTLAQMKLDHRIKMWEESLRNPQPDKPIYVAQDTDGSIVGFASGGPSRKPDSKCQGELYAIYLLKDFHGNKTGTRLFHHIAADLHGKGMNSLLAWVLIKNPSLAFYKKLGGAEFERGTYAIGGQVLENVAMGWPDIRDLLERLKDN